MTYFKDLLIVNKKALPKTIERIIKFWYIIPIIAVSIFIWNNYVDPYFYGNIIMNLLGHILKAMGGACLIYLMRQAIHDGKIYDWKLYNGVRYYTRSLFILVMVMNLFNYGIGIIARPLNSLGFLGFTASYFLYAFIAMLLSAVIEFIYLTNKSEEQIFNAYGHFIKENFLVWFGPMIIFSMLMTFLSVNLIAFRLGMVEIVVMGLLNAAFYFYRASVFEEIVDTSVRKRAFMRLM